MDRNIVHALMNEDLITCMIDPNNYDTVDELINDGIVTIPGAKSRVLEIIDSLNIKPIVEPQETITIIDEPIVLNDPIIDETPVSDAVIDETPVTETPIDETPESEPVIDETPEEEVPTIVETVEETFEVKEKKTTKKTKKTE